ncbi:(deoxy)nucleoside triphosphate pyrophosphohydrolase [Terrabacter sp. 2RAF25]|uniref:(deoxy)nucleoside triphosphate pyrophosphohydrolase n=1 Tax=Terrabacter sp. 2RAF25 TaxID=3232998 RepID=UPI003F98D5E5
MILSEGKVLCARRAEPGKLAGYWEFPGGKVESGESPHEALVREIDEELRCEVAVGAEIESTRHEYDFATIILTTFYCDLTAGHPHLTDHDEVRWCTPEEMGDLEWAPADIPAVKRVRRDLTYGD